MPRSSEGSPGARAAWGGELEPGLPRRSQGGPGAAREAQEKPRKPRSSQGCSGSHNISFT